VRITGGKFKNREVFSPQDKDGALRPTSSKTRQAVFNLLKHGKFLSQVDFLTEEQPDILNGRVVADIFCGTGIMAFEACSRGATRLLLVDKNQQTLELAQKTAKKIGIFDICTFVRANATTLPAPVTQADLIFFDPPYNKGLVAPSLESIAKNRWLKSGGVVICEHSQQEKIVDFSPFELLDQRSYGHSLISILKLTY